MFILIKNLIKTCHVNIGWLLKGQTIFELTVGGFSCQKSLLKILPFDQWIGYHNWWVALSVSVVAAAKLPGAVTDNATAWKILPQQMMSWWKNQSSFFFSLSSWLADQENYLFMASFSLFFLFKKHHGLCSGSVWESLLKQWTYFERTILATKWRKLNW